MLQNLQGGMPSTLRDAITGLEIESKSGAGDNAQQPSLHVKGIDNYDG